MRMNSGPLDEDVLVGTRKRIYEYIRKHPGCYFREIARDLKIAHGDLQYNLNRLEKLGYIVSKKKRLFKHFFVNESMNAQDQALMESFSHETEREIIFLLLKGGNLSNNEMSRLLKLSPPTVSWHVKRLLEAGLVERVQDDRNVKFKLSVSPEKVEQFMMQYRAGFFEKLVDRFTDMWMDLSNFKKSDKNDKRD
nr:transcriptional regulator, ArsR family [uncultured archaeon]